MGVKFGTQKSTTGRLLPPKFHPISAGVKCGTLKSENIMQFHSINTAQGISLCDCYEIFRVCGQFRIWLTIKIWDSFKVFQSHVIFTYGVHFSPKFSAPIVAKLYIKCEYVLMMQKSPPP